MGSFCDCQFIFIFSHMLRQEVSKAFTCLKCYLARCLGVWIHKKMPQMCLAWVSVWLVHAAVPGQRTGIWVPALQGQSVLLYWENVTPKLTWRARNYFLQKISDWLHRKWETQVPDPLQAKRFWTYRFPYLSKRIHKPSGHSEVSESMQSMAMQRSG